MKDKKFRTWFLILLSVNFLLRIIIYYNTELFFFSDFRNHLGAVNKLAEGDTVPLISGNFLFAVSYIGYFLKNITGSPDSFFWLNSFLGTAASALISLLMFKVTEDKKASFITLLILSLYTEFMVFSSVFYTVVIMIFLLSALIFLFFRYYNSSQSIYQLVYLILTPLLVFISFLFKQELLFLPVFMFLAVILFRKEREFVRKTIFLASVIVLSAAVFYKSGIINAGENKLANDFIFFGHTDYGGDGGEGSLIYPENKARYNKAWNEYLTLNGIAHPDITDRNRFQAGEIKKFILNHPGKWVSLQFTKFFRTFGVVPEGISFKILYSGLFANRLWLTSVIIVAPVAAIVLMFILFFNIKAIRKLYNHSNSGLSALSPQPSALSPQPKSYFLKLYLVLFAYYLVASIFFGHYQERYRIPVMVLFIIPTLSYFIASFNKREFLNRTSLLTKAIIVSVFLVTWIIQTHNALNNKQRLRDAIEMVNKNKK